MNASTTRLEQILNLPDRNMEYARNAMGQGSLLSANPLEAYRILSDLIGNGEIERSELEGKFGNDVFDRMQTHVTQFIDSTINNIKNPNYNGDKEFGLMQIRGLLTESEPYNGIKSDFIGAFESPAALNDNLVQIVNDGRQSKAAQAVAESLDEMLAMQQSEIAANERGSINPSAELKGNSSNELGA